MSSRAFRHVVVFRGAPVRGAALLLVLGSLVGCEEDAEQGGTHSEPQELIDAKAGTRLQPRYFEGGGARVFADFYDTELDLPCRFVRTVDDELRCLPGTFAGEAFSGSDSRYADPNCSERAVQFDPCGAGPYAAATSEDRCSYGLVTRVLEAQPDAEPTPGYTLLEDGRCVPDANNAMVVAASEVGLDGFVKATTENVDVVGGLQVQRLIAEDGAELSIGLMRGGHWCWPQQLNGELYCLDDKLADAPAELLPGCTEAVASYQVCESWTEPNGIATPERPGLAISFEWAENGCGRDGRLYRLQAEDTQDDEGICLGFVPGQYDRVALIDSEFAVSELPTLELVKSGSGRLRALKYAHAGQPLLTPTRWFEANTNRDPRGAEPVLFDTELGIECLPTAVAGGEVRCLPVFHEGSDIFSGDSCDEYLMHPPAECQPWGDHRAVISQSRCQVTEIYGRGEPYVGPISGGGEGCQPGGSSTADSPSAYESVAIPLDDFALLELVQ